MDDIAAATASQPACRIKIGRPVVPDAWEEEWLPDAVATLPRGSRDEIVAAGARALWLQDNRQRTVEAWDTTDPAHPRLIVAWAGYDPRDEIDYRRLIGTAIRSRMRPLARGWHVLPSSPDDPTVWRPDFGALSAEQWMGIERSMAAANRALRAAGTIYEPARVARIDELAKRHLAALAAAATSKAA